MKVIKLFLFILTLSIVIGVYDRVSAACYKICSSGYSCYYVEAKSHTECDGKKCSNVEEDIDVPAGSTKEGVSDSLCVFGDDTTDKNYDPHNVVSCGDGMLTDIPKMIPKTVHIFYLLIQIAVPILLVIFGSIDFVKGLTSQKDEDIKKGQQTFIKRLISAGILFFVFSFVKIVISFAADSDKSANILKCTSCIINNNKECKGA